MRFKALADLGGRHGIDWDGKNEKKHKSNDTATEIVVELETGR
jgi:hypothetical protein